MSQTKKEIKQTYIEQRITKRNISNLTTTFIACLYMYLKSTQIFWSPGTEGKGSCEESRVWRQNANITQEDI